LATSRKASPSSPEHQTRASQISEYVLLIRNTAWQKDLSAAAIEEVLAQFSAWVERLKKDGTIKLAFPLAHEGKLFANKSTVTDGPFIESKEAIAGLILFQAESFEAAIEIARSATCLKFGQTLELRPVALEEPERQLARRQGHAA
jgi:hypothetical protein